LVVDAGVLVVAGAGAVVVAGGGAVVVGEDLREGAGALEDALDDEVAVSVGVGVCVADSPPCAAGPSGGGTPPFGGSVLIESQSSL